MESNVQAYEIDFLQELYECLDIFNQAFLDLENSDIAAINEIFRVAHTIREMAEFLAYKSLEKLCYSMEEVLYDIKNGDIEIDGKLIDIMLSAVVRITEMVKKIESEDNDNVRIKNLLNSFDEYDKIQKKNEKDVLCVQGFSRNYLPSSESIPVQTLEDNNSFELEHQDEQQTKDLSYLEDCNLIFSISLSEECLMKDLKAPLVIESLRDICKIIKTNPSDEDMKEDFDGIFKVFVSGDSDRIEELIDRISEIDQFIIISNNDPESFNSELISLMGLKSSKDRYSSDPELQYEQKNKNIGEEDYNLILSVTLSDACVVKDLRASLIIESLRDVCNVIKTDPEEHEMGGDFAGILTVFIAGDSDKVEKLMDSISEIEQYNIISDEQDKYSRLNSEEFQDNVALFPGTAGETISFFSVNKIPIHDVSMFIRDDIDD